jgi:phage RecT family recombinase
MPTELMIPGEERPVVLASPMNPGAELVQKQAEQLLERCQLVSKRQFALAAMNEVNKLPRDTEPRSILTAVFNSAALGLIPGQPLGHAYFVPMKIDKGKTSERRVCQLWTGYKGWVHLSYETGFLADLHTAVVLEGEECEWWNDETGPRLKHVLPMTRSPMWAKVQAAYCIWHARTGGRGIEVVSRDELQKLKRRGNVWDTDPVAMCRKATIPRAAKTWKTIGRLAQAIQLDEEAEGDRLQSELEPVGPSPTRRPGLAAFGGTPQAAHAAAACDSEPPASSEPSDAGGSPGDVQPSENTFPDPDGFELEI